MIIPQALLDLIKEETAQAVSADVAALCDVLKTKGNIAAILFYGSGLWKTGQNDAMYDFYVLVDHTKDVEKRPLQATFGRLLPPNVYVLQTNQGDRTVRCKYALMTQDQFANATLGKSLTPQIWARFAQPSRLVFVRDADTRIRTLESLAQAVITFHRKILPLTADHADTRTIWLTGLHHTYGAELRAEKPERTQALYTANEKSFKMRTSFCLPVLNSVPRNVKIKKLENILIKPLLKLITFVRLMKATTTFDGAVDYALWKIERQSGVKMQATDFQRRHPLIAAWPLLWRLYKQGGFR